VKTEFSYEAYHTHHVFEEINYMMDYYENVSFSCFSFVPTGTNGIANYASYIYLSLKGTLDSIRLVMKAGQLSDAYVLIRKFFDDVLVDIYLDIVRKDKFDWMKSIIVKDVDEWLRGKHRIPGVKQILKVIKESPTSKDLYPFFGWDSYLKHNRTILDDNVHANRYASILLNCRDVEFGDRVKSLDGASIILKQVFTIHLAFIFYLNGQFMMASDYIDSLEIGLTPPEGCENWIASFAQEAFDKYIKPNKQLAIFIKKHCPLGIE